VLVPGARADDVAALDVVFLALAANLGLAPEDQPVLVAVVVVAVEAPALARHSEDTGTGDRRSIRAVAGVHRFLARPNNRHERCYLAFFSHVLQCFLTLPFSGVPAEKPGGKCSACILALASVTFL
jgi:hypothetical protein